MGQTYRSGKPHLKPSLDIKNKSKSVSLCLNFWTIRLQCAPTNTTRDTTNHPQKARNTTFLCLSWGRRLDNRSLHGTLPVYKVLFTLNRDIC
eukprot:5977959-Ditylum_brightwellii.AAC.1